LQNYDIGSVLSGEVVSHAFIFTNTTGEPMTIHADEDIRKDCGCSAVKPEVRALAAGASTKVVVTVATKGKIGRFADGGTIAWSLPNGEKKEASFKLQGEVRAALESDPPSLGFGPDEINGRITKEIKFTANVPLDWAKAKVNGYDSLVQVAGWKVSEDAAICKVKCFMADGVEAANGRITVEVPLAKPRPDFSSATIWVPVQGHQAIEFTVAPKQLPVKIDKASGRVSARLLVRGKKLASSKRPITAITCEGYGVDWKMTEPSKGLVAVVTVDLVPLGDAAPKGEPTLVIQVDGMEPIRLPVVRLTVVEK